MGRSAWGARGCAAVALMAGSLTVTASAQQASAQTAPAGSTHALGPTTPAPGRRQPSHAGLHRARSRGPDARTGPATRRPANLPPGGQGAASALLGSAVAVSLPRRGAQQQHPLAQRIPVDGDAGGSLALQPDADDGRARDRRCDQPALCRRDGAGQGRLPEVGAGAQEGQARAAKKEVDEATWSGVRHPRPRRRSEIATAFRRPSLVDQLQLRRKRFCRYTTRCPAPEGTNRGARGGRWHPHAELTLLDVPGDGPSPRR